MTINDAIRVAMQKMKRHCLLRKPMIISMLTGFMAFTHKTPFILFVVRSVGIAGDWSFRPQDLANYMK